jgi:predicted Zn-dependent protease
MPNDPEVMARKASIYQAQGNLQEAGRFLSEINEQSSWNAFVVKITQLRLERNYGEAVRLQQARQDQFHFASQYDKANAQMFFVLTQRVAGDTVGATVTAQQARKTIEQLYRDEPDNWDLATTLSQVYAVIGEKDSALKLAEHAVMLYPRSKSAIGAPAAEEDLALTQMMCGENSHAISTLARLLQTPYLSEYYISTSITPALLRLDPLWDSLRADPAFQKLCEERQPPATP